MATTDKYLDSFISNMTRHNEDYVLIFTSSHESRAQEPALPYEMDEPYPSALHTDLKRHIHEHSQHAYTRRAASNSTVNTQSQLPLFEKYQFLSPGKFLPPLARLPMPPIHKLICL
jgi:hypothetical protein